MAGIRWTQQVAVGAMALVWVLLLSGVGAAQAGKTDKEKFQGDWIVHSATKGGQELPELVTKSVKANFKGDKITLEFAGEKTEGVAKLDESKKPKTIDITVEDKTLLGIYQVEGDTLKVCLSDPGQARPTKFESPANTEVILVVFKRPKAAPKDKKGEAKPNPTPLPLPGDKKDKIDQEKLKGSWTLVSGVKDGKDAPKDILDKFKMTFSGDKVIVEGEGAGPLEGSFKLDAKTKPKSIDLTIKDKAALGIYQWEGDALQICIMEPGKEGRPTKFAAPAGSNCILLILKRVKPACDEEQSVLFVPPTGQGDKKKKTDQEKLKGSWTLVSGENNGKEAPKDILAKFKLTFSGDKITLEGVGGGTLEGSFKLDPKAKPQSIDLTLKDKPAQGIYQLEGDTLKLCFKEPGKEGRPTEFKAPEGSDCVNMVLKRAKPACDEEQPILFVPTPAQGDKKDKSDKDLFQGSWKFVEGLNNGEKPPQDFLDNIKISFKGDRAIMEFMGKSKEGDFKLDATTKPKSIDMTIQDKPHKGIYQLEGDTLKICFKENGGERPAKFDGSEGSNNILIVLKRDKVEKKEGKKESGVQFTPADFAACCADESGDKGDKKTDKDKFQGNWDVVSAEKGGEKIGADMVDQIKIKFAGDKLALELFGTKSEGTFKLDPSKNPKTIDLTLDDKTAQGIYEFTGDSLKIALGEPGKARPKNFNGTDGTENSLVVLKRVKTAKQEKKGETKTTPKEEVKEVPTKQAKGDPTPKGKKTDKEGLQGVWKLVALEVSGKKMDANELVGMRLIFVGDKVTAILGGVNEHEEGTFQVNPTKEPRQLDLTLQGKTMQAIYRLEGDKLVVCGSEPGVGSGRPSAFQTADTKTGLLVLERAKNERPDGFNANATVSINNLKQIALAMHNYNAVNKKLPGAAIYSKDGKPLLSWRVAILPYVEGNNLYQQFKLDEPWDSEHNKKLIGLMPRVYTPYNSGTERKSKTPYRVFTGPKTPFEGFGKNITFADFTDGTSNTILVVEAEEQVPWTKPDEFPFDPKKDLPKLGGRPFADRFHIAMADASVRSVNVEFDATVFRAMITRNGGENVDLDKLNKPKKSDK